MNAKRRTFPTACLVLLAMTSLCLADEPKAVVLFDGKDTTGWKQAGPGKFDLHDGVITGDGGMGLFWNEKEFGDFDLKLQFKVSREQDNSGVFVRFPDPGNDPWVAVKEGYEIQICNTEKDNQTGAIYSAKNSTELATKPVGEWNDYDIKVVGKHYTVTLNGKVVNEYDAEKPALRGHIGVQNHDPKSHVSFRDIRVIDLGGAPAPKAEAKAADTKAAEAQAAALEPQPIAHDRVQGLVGEYFRNIKDFDEIAKAPASEPFLVRVDENIGFSPVNGQFYKSKLATDFGVRWNGFLRVSDAGTYTMQTKSDDGVRVYIGDRLVIDGAKAEVMKAKTAKVDLKPGDYPLRVEFQQSTGGAACLLQWKTPTDKAEQEPYTIKPANLFHDPKQEQVAWDKAAFDKTVWSHRAWAKQYGEKYDKMDYGPFISHTVAVDEKNKNYVNKGISIHLGKEDEAAVTFDTELLRYGVGWTGGFLTMRGVVFDGEHGVNPSPDGNILYTTKEEPGAVEGNPPAPEEGLKDPRPRPFGPLPKDWGRYTGLYIDGNQIVLAYTVGTTQVLEMPGVQRIGDTEVFTRTFHLGASDKPLSILLNDETENPDAPLPAMTAAASASVKVQWPGHGRRWAIFPPRTQPQTYKVALFKTEGAAVSPDAVAKIVDAAQDLTKLVKGGPAHWTKTVQTKGEIGKNDGPYVLDTITAPEDNPYHSWLRFGGFDFFSDGRAALCTWSGDVWIVSGIDASLSKLTWKRYATGLFQTLGLKIVDDQVYVLGRDQITRFKDLNGDGEADYYENFNNDCEVTPSFHEFAFDLQTDSQGNFYFAKAGPVRPGGRGWQIMSADNGTMMKISKDGKKFEVFATGLRAPNGMSVGPHDEITVGDNEGTWVPACRLSLVKEGMMLGVPDLAKTTPEPTTFDYPICWLPHGDVDNSSGGQVWVPNDKWGPFDGDLLHMSYGTCSLFKVMYEHIDGGPHKFVQGGVVKFPNLNFITGICRARFNARDNQLYVAGLRGWQTTAAKDAGFQRVRYTGKPVHMPKELHVLPHGIAITFTTPVDPASISDLGNFAVEQWNYVWSNDYGSPEMSVADPKEKGHDPVEVTGAKLSADHKTLTLTLDEVVPVMQMKIQMKVKAADGAPMEYSIYNTINKVPKANATPTASSASAKQ
jgi:hypothetical protein